MEFLDLTRLFKRAWLIALAMLIGGAVALFIALIQPTSYLGKARLLVGPGISNTQPDLNVLRASGQLIQTYAELPLTEPFLQAIIDELELNLTTSELAEMLNVRPNPETQILTIEVKYSDAAQAQAIAGLIATKLVQISPSNPESSAAQLRGQVGSHVQEMEQSIAETRQSIQLLHDDYQKAINQELLSANSANSTQVIAIQLNEFEQNADLIANAATQGAAGVSILESLIANTNARILWFEQELKPDLNPISRKIISDQMQADRVHLSNLQQGVVELSRPIEGQPLNEFIDTTQLQIKGFETTLDESINVDFRRLQLDRISLGQQKLNQARAIESDRQKLILARIAEERDRIYKVDLLNLENQQAILKELEVEQGQLSEMQNTLSVLYSSVQAAAPNHVEIIELAKTSASNTPVSLMVLIGSLTAASLTVVGILASDYFNDTVETSDQIISMCPVPVVTINDEHSPLFSMLNNQKMRTERLQKYQMLSMRLLYTNAEFDRKLVLVAPTDANGDAGIVATQMAIFLSKAGKRVILIDANPEQSALSSFFHLKNRPGLSDYVGGSVKRSLPITVIDRYPNLGLLPFGNTPLDTSFLATPYMLAQLERLNDRADVVLISAPDLHRPDILMLASHTRGVIMVVTRGKTTQKMLSEVVESLNMVGAKILAAVLKPANIPGESQDISKMKGATLSQAELPGGRTHAADTSDSNEVGTSMTP